MVLPSVMLLISPTRPNAPVCQRANSAAADLVRPSTAHTHTQTHSHPCTYRHMHIQAVYVTRTNTHATCFIRITYKITREITPDRKSHCLHSRQCSSLSLSFSLQEHAFESSQKYKEGKFIIELAHMIKDNGWD